MIATVNGPVWLPSLPPSLEQFLAPNLQPVPVLPAVALLLATAYVAGAVRLWKQGRRWSVVRTICFLLGCLLLLVITGAGIEGYGYTLFSVFMFQQLTLMMIIPPLLVLGSPGTLLLRATPHKGFGRLVLRLAHAGLRSRVARFVLHPALLIPFMILSYFGLYLGGAANILLSTWVGHVAVEAGFLVVGILSAVPLISVDPLPRKTSHAGRLLDTIADMQIHAGFGLVMMLTQYPLVAYFTSAPAAWDIDPVRDQGLAGVLAWTYGEVPLLIILIVTMARWAQRDTTRAARAQERTDIETDAYNDYLRRLSSGPSR